jgi:hypothetical protein
LLYIAEHYLIDKLLEDVEPFDFHEEVASLGLRVVLHLRRHDLLHQLHQLILLADVRHFLGVNF